MLVVYENATARCNLEGQLNVATTYIVRHNRRCRFLLFPEVKDLHPERQVLLTYLVRNHHNAQKANGVPTMMAP